MPTNNNVRRVNRRRAKRQPRRVPRSLLQGRQFLGSRTISTGSDLRPYKFSKLLSKGVVTSTSAAEGLYAYQFALADLSEVSSFTSIFDQYRINRIDLLVRPLTNPSTTANVSVPYAFAYVVTDLDDAATLASASLSLNYQNCSILSPGQSHARHFVPHVLISAFDGAAAFASSKAAPWIDCANTNVVHYGAKISITQSTSTLISSWYVWTRDYVEFRCVR